MTRPPPAAFAYSDKTTWLTRARNSPRVTPRFEKAALTRTVRGFWPSPQHIPIADSGTERSHSIP